MSLVTTLTITALVAMTIVDSSPAAARDDVPSVVEDFAYPGAAQILAEHGIRVLRGDGRIRFVADCPPASSTAPDGLFRVESLPDGDKDPYCFEVRGPRGYLTVDIPNVYLAIGAGREVIVRATYEGQTETTTVPPNLPAAIGGGNATHTLMEIRTTSDTPLPEGTDSPYPFVAKVDVAGRSCSGVLVARQWIATAKACFGDGAVADGPPPSPATVVVGRNDMEQAGGFERSVVELVSRSDRDLVLAKLDRSVLEVAPIALTGTTAGTGQQLRVSGYGRTGTDWVGTRLRTGDFTVATVGGTTVELVRSEGTATSTCKGDAGGPTFRLVDGVAQLVAISSGSWQTGCMGTTETRDSAVQARTDDITGWIGDQVRSPDVIDFNRDGLADAGGFYDYSNGRTALFTWQRTSPDTFEWPVNAWDSGTGSFEQSRMKQVAGDFNGDGRTDVAAFYDYSNGRTALFLWAAKASGGFESPVNVWDSGVGGFEQSRAKPVAGDFNGDGRTDVAAFYDYSNGRTALFLWAAKASGGFEPLVSQWDSGVGGFEQPRAKPVAGDFNGDGRCDVAAFYDYSNGRTALFVWAAKASGGFEPLVSQWDSGNGMFEQSRMKPVAGDFNGDGRTDVAAFYDYSNGRTALFAWARKASGGFESPVNAWDSGAGGLEQPRVKPIAGDFDNDGRTDIGAFYDYSNGRTALFTWIANGSGGFAGRANAWDSGNGTFEHSRLKAF